MGKIKMIEKNKNMYELKERPNQIVLCECGEPVIVWLNVNGEGKTKCKCNREITVEKHRRKSSIVIYQDASKNKAIKTNCDISVANVV